MNPIDQLNKRLGAELGRNPHGGGLYEWHRANTLLRPVLTGHMAIDPAPGSLLSTVEPVYEARPMMPELGSRWALCLWNDAGSAQDWHRQFGNRTEWPKRGYYAPTNAVLNEGEEPNLDTTIAVIGMVRNDRARTMADLMADGDAIVERQERADYTWRDDAIGGCLPAFGNWKPGARCGGVSLPTREFAQNIEGVAFGN